MTSGQKAIKYAAIAFAIFLIVNIGIGIVSLLGSTLFIFSDNDDVGDYAEYTINEQIDSLDIDINAAVIDVQTGDGFALESNCEKLTVEEKNGTLVIEERSKKLFRKNKAEVILTIPKGYEFKKVRMVAGAGKVSIYELSAVTMDMNFGAGEVDIVGLTAGNDIKIEGGVGEVSIDRCELNNAKINMGVGEFNITGKLSGRSDIDYGVGEANLNLAGSKDDYTIEMNKGLGESKIDGNSVKSDIVYGDGENYIAIDGGIGEIEVDFY